MLPIKIDVQTNIQDGELTIETCSQIIEMLQNSYHTIRNEMYTYFLGMKHLKKELVFVAILALLYLLTEEMLFIYFMPISVLLAFISAIVSAEYITKQTRKQIINQIQHFNEKKEKLIRNQKLKA